MSEKPTSPNPNFKDLSGQRFGRLAVIERWPNTVSGAARWRCGCDCGRWTVARSNELLQGKTRSCGCLAREIAAERCRRTKRRHGMSEAGGEYTVWQQMRGRCLNPRNHGYGNYGRRGIRVDPAWAADFTAFYRDMGPRPTSAHSLDRRDVDGHYTPDNCRWATATEQANNRRCSRRIAFDGLTLTLSEWADRVGIMPESLAWRLAKGWPLDRALTTGRGRTGPKTFSRRRFGFDTMPAMP